MVLSPQCFHNLNLHSDIFNHSNVHFWEYMQPGYDTLGFISCTGKFLFFESLQMFSPFPPCSMPVPPIVVKTTLIYAEGASYSRGFFGSSEQFVAVVVLSM